MKREKHLFALFYDHSSLSDWQVDQSVVIADKELAQRIQKVLRLYKDDSFILFNDECHVLVTLMDITPKKIVALVRMQEKNKKLLPSLIVYPALLKKESFEEVVYSCAQMGVEIIQPIISSKVKREWGGEKELSRLQKIMIAACEQSKQFIIPHLASPILFDDFIASNKSFGGLRLFFDAEGKPFTSLLQELSSSKSIEVMIGPEGDFTQQEKEALDTLAVKKVALTSSILRSQDATLVALGLVRSCVK